MHDHSQAKKGKDKDNWSFKGKVTDHALGCIKRAMHKAKRSAYIPPTYLPGCKIVTDGQTDRRYGNIGHNSWHAA